MATDPNNPTIEEPGAGLMSEPLISADSTVSPRTRRSLGTWFRRLGVAGFLFFLIKGLMWLALPALIALWRHLER